MSDEKEIAEAFALISKVAIQEGAAPLDGKVWTSKVDHEWTVAINGKREEAKIEPEAAMAVTLPPANAAVWFNGFLAGTLSPYGGVIAAGAAANEDNLIRALKRRLERKPYFCIFCQEHNPPGEIVFDDYDSPICVHCGNIMIEKARKE